MESKNIELRVRPTQKFAAGDDVLTPLTGRSKKMRIMGSFWEEESQYHSVKGGTWIYRLAFLTMNGNLDKRRNLRRFEEAVLIPSTPTEQTRLKEYE
jgi:hypothetical protein